MRSEECSRGVGGWRHEPTQGLPRRRDRRDRASGSTPPRRSGASRDGGGARARQACRARARGRGRHRAGSVRLCSTGRAGGLAGRDPRPVAAHRQRQTTRCERLGPPLSERRGGMERGGGGLEDYIKERQMNAMNMLNLVLWIVQGLLALFFLAAGAPKVIGRGLERWTGFSDLPGPMVVFIGFTEVLGAAGLVLPMATGVVPWLTPLAAVGLALIVLMAAGFHLRADERLNALESGFWASIAAVIAIGRWDLVPTHVHAPAKVLVLALSLLVPAVIINLVVLFRRPVNSGTA